MNENIYWRTSFPKDWIWFLNLCLQSVEIFRYIIMYPIPLMKGYTLNIFVFGLVPTNLKSKQAGRQFVLQVFLVLFRGL